LHRKIQEIPPKGGGNIGSVITRDIAEKMALAEVVIEVGLN